MLHLISTREIILRPGFNVLDSGELIAEIDTVPYCDLTLEEINERMHTDFGAEPFGTNSIQMSEPKKLEGFNLYPNPAERVVNLVGDKVTFQAILIDSRGQLIKNYETKIITLSS